MKTFLLLYVIVFFGSAMIWPTYRTWRTTGVNPYRLSEQTGLAGFVGAVFRLELLAIILVVLLNVFAAGMATYLTPIAWLEHPALRGLGVALMILAAILVIVAQVHMGASWRIGIDKAHTTPLVTHGIFGRSRNPIFLGMRIMLVGLFLVLPSAATLALWLVGDVLIQVQVFLEEDYLAARHGMAYEAYRRRVRRWL